MDIFPYSQFFLRAVTRRWIYFFCILILLASAQHAFAGNQGSVTLTPDETASWNASGFNASQASEWKYYGIGPVDARKWVDAGIMYPGWAQQWIGEGVSAGEAKYWHKIANVYTAGEFLRYGFSWQEAKQWMDSGVASGLRAKEYREAGLSVAQGGSFWKLGIYPDEAGQWHKTGFGPEETFDWRYGPKEIAYFNTKETSYGRVVYKPEWATQWRSAGFTPAEAHNASTYRVELIEAAKWRASGFSFNEMMEWMDSGFSIGEALVNKPAGMRAAGAELARYEKNDVKGDEIISLNVDIALDKDGAVDVIRRVELVTRPGGVYAQGYKARLWKGPATKFSLFNFLSAGRRSRVKSVEVDGARAAYTVTDGVITVGGLNAPPGQGSRVIRISYVTDSAVKAIPDHDELFFELLKDNQDVFIRKAEAVVRLPRGADVVFTDGYAGLSQRKDFLAMVEETGSGDVVRFTAARPLWKKMDFQITVAFLKGFVDEGIMRGIARMDLKAGRLLSSLAIFVFGFFILILYYYLAWRKVGRDPKGRGNTAAAPLPPDGMDPALIRLLYTKGSVDHTSVAATLVHLAGIGAVRITESKGIYTVGKAAGVKLKCSSHAEAFLDAFFGDDDSLVISGGEGGKRIDYAKKSLADSLKGERAKLGASNVRYLLPGIVMSIAVIILSLAAVDYNEVTRSKAVIFFSAYAGFMSFVFCVQALIFGYLLKAPTEYYVKAMARVDGYLASIKGNYLEQLRGAAFIPQPLQGHLPYAMAFGIDCSRFLIHEGDAPWYRGSSGGFSFSDFEKAVKGKTR